MFSLFLQQRQLVSPRQSAWAQLAGKTPMQVAQQNPPSGPRPDPAWATPEGSNSLRGPDGNSVSIRDYLLREQAAKNGGTIGGGIEGSSGFDLWKKQLIETNFGQLGDGSREWDTRNGGYLPEKTPWDNGSVFGAPGGTTPKYAPSPQQPVGNGPQKYYAPPPTQNEAFEKLVGGYRNNFNGKTLTGGGIYGN